MVEWQKPEDLDSRPPINEQEELEKEGKRLAEEGAVEELKKGKVPLHPAFVRLPFSITGRAAAAATGYPGFEFTDRELNDLAELWMQCGVTVSPVMQAAVATIVIVGIKTISYAQWKKAGKPKSAESESKREE
jgi:hypothetical protein